MKVKVVKDVALLHGGQPFTEGDVVELPDRAAPRKRSG
jgi:hypothetical protein